jgi:hypothetical protein
MPYIVVAPGLHWHVFVPGRYAEIERLGNFFEQATHLWYVLSLSGSGSDLHFF